MTSNVEQTYQKVLLADAAYINFEKGTHYSKSDGTIELTAETEKLFLKRGFTHEQFVAFQKKYKIYKPANGKVAHQQNTNSGFAATIFEERSTNKLTVAFRGTEPGATYGADLLQDIVLALGASTSVGQLLQDGKIQSFLQENGLIDGAGIATSGFQHNVDFVGHSLGGHLTLMAAYQYPSLMGQGYTFNGAGVGSIDKLFLEKIQPLFDGNAVDLSHMHNVYAKPGFEVTSNEIPYAGFGRDGQGSRDGIFIEKQGTDLSMNNHSARFLVDALSVDRILAMFGGYC